MIKELCHMTACSINNIKYKHALLDEQIFFTYAKENGLIPFVYETIDHKQISSNLLSHLKKHYYAFIAHDTKALFYIKQVNDILNQNQIKHIFMKGSILKPLYPKTYHRGMGDIDILIQDKDLKSVHQIFKSHNILLNQVSEQHDGFIIGGEITLEIHPKLYKDFNSKYDILFSNPWQHTYQKDEHEYRFKPTFEIIYLLYHLAKHLDTGGIGLRSVLDIGIYLDYYKDDINKTELLTLLKQTDMVKFFTQMIYLNIKYYHFKDLDQFLLDPLLTDKQYDEIITFITRSGLHGKGSQYNPFEARIASNELKEKTRLHLFMTLVFPSYKTMSGQYRIIKKIPILLPIVWLIRIIKLLLFKTKNTLKRIFQLNIDSKDIQEIKSVYTYLGL